MIYPTAVKTGRGIRHGLYLSLDDTLVVALEFDLKSSNNAHICVRRDVSVLWCYQLIVVWGGIHPVDTKHHQHMYGMYVLLRPPCLHLHSYIGKEKPKIHQAEQHWNFRLSL
jgi:hypothetical protein